MLVYFSQYQCSETQIFFFFFAGGGNSLNQTYDDFQVGSNYYSSGVANISDEATTSQEHLPTSENIKIVLSEDDYNLLSASEAEAMCPLWNRQEIVDFVVTEFRRNPGYISVSNL